MAKSGILHIVTTVPVTKSQFEGEEFHALNHGTSFPASPDNYQLFFRDDLKKWFIYYNGLPIDLTYGATEVNTAIATHAALTTGVHGAGSNHLALFGAASTLVSRVVWKDVSENALSDENRSSTLDWTDLDLTAYTSADAKFAIVKLEIVIDSYTNGTIVLRVRKNGTTPSDTPALLGRQGTENANYAWSRDIVGLDSGRVLEYRLEVTGTAQADFRIYVLGYIE